MKLPGAAILVSRGMKVLLQAAPAAYPYCSAAGARMDDGSLCVLKDCVESFSDDGPLDPVPGEMYTVAELVGHLRAAVAGPPRQFNLELPGDIRVVLHLGGSWAAIRWCRLCYNRLGPPPSDRTASQARAERPPPIPPVSFMLSGREADVRPEWLLPADEVVRMAAHMAEHRALPPWGVWVDSDGGPVGGPGHVIRDDRIPF